MHSALAFLHIRELELSPLTCVENLNMAFHEETWKLRCVERAQGDVIEWCLLRTRGAGRGRKRRLSGEKTQGTGSCKLLKKQEKSMLPASSVKGQNLDCASSTREVNSRSWSMPPVKLSLKIQIGNTRGNNSLMPLRFPFQRQSMTSRESDLWSSQRILGCASVCQLVSDSGNAVHAAEMRIFLCCPTPATTHQAESNSNPPRHPSRPRVPGNRRLRPQRTPEFLPDSKLAIPPPLSEDLGKTAEEFTDLEIGQGVAEIRRRVWKPEWECVMK